MACATRLTKVGQRREHFDERTWLCSHQVPPSERVVAHVRDAGQAMPHLEHSPVSLLGTCYATLIRVTRAPRPRAAAAGRYYSADAPSAADRGGECHADRTRA